MMRKNVNSSLNWSFPRQSSEYFQAAAGGEPANSVDLTIRNMQEVLPTTVDLDLKTIDAHGLTEAK